MASTTVEPTSATAESPKMAKRGSVSEVKSPVTATQASYGCQHIKGLLQQARQQAVNGYTRLIQSLNKEGNICDSIHKSSSGTSTTGRATYLCLQCPVVSSTMERHRKEHLFSVESIHGFILCHECRDFVYDPTFEEIRTSNTAKKRKHSAFAEPGDKRLVAINTSTTPCAATGLRGLYNMGQTCFMSVILQSLIHNPFIRTFYLSEGHKSSECEREACTSCALDDIFTDFYAQEKHEGYGAVHMLQGCWKGGGGLAGYSQQDAHEYLGFILNSLHTANTADDDEDESQSKKERDPKDCDCMVHQVFGGLLKSTVTCTACRTTSTTTDPFTDLSLDVRGGGTVKVEKKKQGLSNGTGKHVLPVDLTDCLDRFTSIETLSADSYHCRKCDKAQEAEKRLRVQSLPPVLPIHLKRFSHSKTLATSSKIDNKVRFPFLLNLKPYTSPPSVKKVKLEDANGDSKDDKTRHEPIYVLSSVIVHKGKIDNGHYISYSRQGDDWFRFDDSMVVQVDEKEVLGAEAYMLFYVVRDFDA